MAVEDDAVIAEYDVHLCNGLAGTKAQTLLFQYPLRPPWRPYAIDESREMRIKPEARRIEMTAKLEMGEDTYNPDVEDAKKLTRLTLRSTPVDLASSFAIASIRDGKLLLMPVDEALQMRPDLGHLDTPAAKPAAAEAKPVTTDQGPVPLQVEVKRRETERQQQWRLKSYAYISKQEADEKWTPITMNPADSNSAAVLWDRLASGPETQLPLDLSREEYLSACLPSSSRHAAGQRAAPGNADQLPHAATNGNARAGQQAGQAAEHSASANGGQPMEGVEIFRGPPLSDGDARCLKQALMELFRNTPVVSLFNIREWLATAKSAQLVSHFAQQSDTGLRHAVMQLNVMRQMGQAFVQTDTGSQGTDMFRGVVLDLLAKQESVRKQEVMSAVAREKLSLTDTQYTKLMKEICESNGALWSLKTLRNSGIYA